MRIGVGVGNGVSAISGVGTGVFVIVLVGVFEGQGVWEGSGVRVGRSAGVGDEIAAVAAGVHVAGTVGGTEICPGVIDGVCVIVGAATMNVGKTGVSVWHPESNRANNAITAPASPPVSLPARPRKRSVNEPLTG